MEALIARQAAILSEIKRIHTNFLKNSASRKTKEYVRVRVTALDNLWAECKQNDEQLLELDDKNHEYFTDGIIQVIQDWYEGTRSEILSWEMKLHTSPAPAQPEGTTSAGTESSKRVTIQFDSTRFERPKVMDTLTELQQLQNANFRTFKSMSSETLISTGLITLGQGCVLRGDTFMLYAHMEYASQAQISSEKLILSPEISPINNIVNTSINSSFHIENHNKLFKHIENQIDLLKQ
ncbi:hypothetical protein ACJJTC_003949 [Scirpophaga incertulas]